jgi:NAD(P)-dependent dehydrogenase (short-subunit alcohol dehydrogenase family)
MTMLNKASGMGLAVVENLVERGWNVAIVDKNSKHGEAAKERLGAQTEFFETNVADWDQQSKVFVETWDKWGRIDFGELSAVS